jgi:hypothetical protein
MCVVVGSVGGTLVEEDIDAATFKNYRHISSLPMGAQLLHIVTSYHFLANILSKLKTERTLLDCSAKRIKLLVM